MIVFIGCAIVLFGFYASYSYGRIDGRIEGREEMMEDFIEKKQAIIDRIYEETIDQIQEEIIKKYELKNEK